MPDPVTAMLLLTAMYSFCFAISLCFKLLYEKRRGKADNKEEDCVYKIVEQPVRRRRRKKTPVNTVFIRGKIVPDEKAGRIPSTDNL